MKFCILFLIYLAQACIPLECIELGLNICARKSLSTIMLNQFNTCPSGYSCLTSDLLSFETSSSEFQSCAPITNDTDYNWSSFVYECGTRQSNKDFYNGGSLVRCISDEDCVLKDGTFTTCECGSDGSSYCDPTWDSEAFNGYWSQCETGLSYNQLKFWTLYKKYYTIWATMGSLECIAATLYEPYIMSSITSVPSQGLLIHSLTLLVLNFI